MKKVLAAVGGVIVLAVVGFVAAVSMQPATTHVERSVVIEATPADIFPYANDFTLWQQWDPWGPKDPNQVTEISDPASGVGASMSWTSEINGSGSMTIKESVENEKVIQDLEFKEPWESQALAGVHIAPEGEATKVTWTLDTQNNFGAKMAGLFMDMDEMVGADYEAGLASLKDVAEKAAAERIAEEEAKLAAEEAEGAEGEEGEGDEATDEG